MAVLIEKPTRIVAAGNKVKYIDEFVGHVNNGESRLSIAQMDAPDGWVEPGQTPEFDEYTIVLAGVLVVESKSAPPLRVAAGQAVMAKGGEWVRYSTPEGPCQYVAVCLPAFSPGTVNRDE